MALKQRRSFQHQAADGPSLRRRRIAMKAAWGVKSHQRCAFAMAIDATCVTSWLETGVLRATSGLGNRNTTKMSLAVA
ncbi:hypothetical protein [Polaromonas glacialis]|uniref:hypothetical protein n=1 Tax=Polaromonas glacialis TaxID=866564 RepID=UPI0012EB6270|nr:hypothetical protein [Polaromonas glacialis]